ncbi:MAG: methionine gamma-lyase family protein [Vampirovibrionales bacterium]|nr:methionine gamma-lyase family protein [Vampirovibrionales bacterium]
MTTEHSLILEAQHALTPCWQAFDATAQVGFNRVLEAMITERVHEACFASVTGYGHDDVGRDVLDRVFAKAFQAEAALVRPHLVSGTHAIAVALNGCLQPGDTLLSLTGKPYDTLWPVLGLDNDPASRSLTGLGIQYSECNVLSQHQGNDDALEGWTVRTVFTSSEIAQIQAANVVLIQRSRGYSARPALLIEDIQALCEAIKAVNAQAIVFVDNCYGEFIAASEPCAVGVDLVAGSLIKNPGAGIVPTGGYIAGRNDLVSRAADVLTCPGIGADGGYLFDMTRTLLQGLFLAPGVVKEAKMGMSLWAYVLEHLGYETAPGWNAPRGDIIQALGLGSAHAMATVCKAIQSASPVNAFVTPEAATFPGYCDPVMMAGGTFIEGSSIELSADGPVRSPYTLYCQGGLTLHHARYALNQLLMAETFQTKRTL